MSLIGNGIRLNGNPGLYSGGPNLRTAVGLTKQKHHSNWRSFWFSEATVAIVPAVVSAWTFGSSIMAVTNKASSSSWSPVTTGALTAGEVGILQINFDNIGTTIGDNSEVTSVTDAAGNTWTKAREYTYSAGAAGDGATVSVWYSKITSTLSSGGAVTINFSGNTTAKVALLNRFTLSNGGTVTVVGSSVETQAGADPGSMSVTPSSGSREHLFYRAIALETTIGAPTNTASYTLLADSASTGGAATSNIYGSGEWRIFTGASDTSDPTYSAIDNVSVFIAFDVGGAGSVSSVANRSGWPSGSTHPHNWVMPIKGGGMASRGWVTGSGDITSANVASGRNLSAALVGVGDITNALAGLIVSATANLTGTGTITNADLRAFLNAVAALTGSGDITTANRTAIGNMVAPLTGSGTIAVTPSARGNMSAAITASGGVLDSSNVASLVLAGVIEAGYDLREVLALLAARELGSSTGGPTAPAYKGLDGTTTRVTASVTSVGDRSSVVLTP